MSNSSLVNKNTMNSSSNVTTIMHSNIEKFELIKKKDNAIYEKRKDLLNENKKKLENLSKRFMYTVDMKSLPKDPKSYHYFMNKKHSDNNKRQTSLDRNELIKRFLNKNFDSDKKLNLQVLNNSSSNEKLGNLKFMANESEQIMKIKNEEVKRGEKSKMHTVNSDGLVTNKLLHSAQGDLFLTNLLSNNQTGGNYENKRLFTLKNPNLDQNQILEKLKNSKVTFEEDENTIINRRNTKQLTNKSSIPPAIREFSPHHNRSNKNKSDKSTEKFERDFYNKLTLKHRATVTNNLNKRLSNLKSRSKSQTNSQNNSLDISAEDEIFNQLPELQLKYNLMSEKEKNKNNLGLNLGYTRSPRKMDKKTKIFNEIYKIDEKFNEEIKKAKGQKKLPLLEYQNKLVLLLSQRMSKENLRKLSERLRDVRDLAEKVKDIGKIDWGEIEEMLKEAKIEKKRSRVVKKEEGVGVNNGIEIEHLKSNPISKENTLHKSPLVQPVSPIHALIPQNSVHISNSGDVLDLSPRSPKRKETKNNTNINRMANVLSFDLAEQLKNTLKVKW